MPDPISSCVSEPRFAPEGATAEEIEAQASLPRPLVSTEPPPSPEPAPPPAPAVKKLVEDVAPAPRSEPSYLKAAFHNTLETAAMSVTCSAAMKAPSLWTVAGCGAVALITARKIEEHMNAQRREAADADAVRVCESKGDVPVRTPDGGVGCVKR